MINDSIAKSLYRHIKHCKNHKLKSVLQEIHRKTFLYNKDGNFVVRGMYKEINHPDGVRELMRPNGVVIYLQPINGVDHVGVKYTNVQNNTTTEKERTSGRGEKEQIYRTLDVLFTPENKLLKFTLLKKSVFRDSVFSDVLNHEDVVERIYETSLKPKRKGYDKHRAITIVTDITGDNSNTDLITNTKEVKIPLFTHIDLVGVALNNKFVDREFSVIEKCVDELPTPQVNKDKELTKQRTNLPVIKEENKVSIEQIITTVVNREEENIKE